MYKCETCGYEGKDTEFSDMVCPACCTNIETGKVVENAIPTVFQPTNIFKAAKTWGMDIGGSTKSTFTVTVRNWTTKDGRQIPINKMATQHIKNCLKMLKDQGYISMETLQFYLHCPEPTAEGAYDAFSQELDRVLESDVNPYIDYFEAELKKRGEKE